MQPRNIYHLTAYFLACQAALARCRIFSAMPCDLVCGCPAPLGDGNGKAEAQYRDSFYRQTQCGHDGCKQAMHK